MNLRRPFAPFFKGALLVFAIALSALFAKPAFAKSTTTTTPDPLRLEVPGYPDAFYVKPRSKSLRSVFLYMHGRGGNPFEDCRKWSRVASRFGWVVCPQGPIDHGGGSREWGSIDAGKKVVDATIAALREKYKGRVRARGNVLIGFSEGALLAQQIGVHDPEHWNRWLILAANDQYWFGDAQQLLQENRKKIRKVFLFTGENDQVVQNTVRAGEMLKKENIAVRVQITPGIGHEVPADRMITNYRRPLRWLISAR